MIMYSVIAREFLFIPLRRPSEVLAAFVSLVLVVGCGHERRAEIKADPQIAAAAGEELRQAEYTKKWSLADQRAFTLHVSQLPTEEHFVLARRLNALISSGAQVEREKPEPPTCSCPAVRASTKVATAEAPLKAEISGAQPPDAAFGGVAHDGHRARVMVNSPRLTQVDSHSVAPLGIKRSLLALSSRPRRAAQ